MIKTIIITGLFFGVYMNKNYSLIVGVGNILLSDDGIGVHLLRELEKEKCLENVQFLDMGTSSMDLGYYINENINKLVIMDSIKSKDDSGTIFKMGLEDLISRKRENFSLHQLELIDTLKLVSLDKDFPDTIIIGIVPYDIQTLSEELSIEIDKKFSNIYKEICMLIKDFLKIK